MNENDLEYLRNINTSPGPNAGRSIDPTKPGPDAEPTVIKTTGYNMGDDGGPCMGLAQSDAEPDSNLEEMVSRWEALKDGGGPSAPWGVLQDELFTIISLARKGLTASPRRDDAEPVAWRWRYRSAPEEWHVALVEFYGDDLIVEPLYTAAAPRPDASAEFIEKVARAIAQVRHGSEGYRDEDDGVQFWELCIDEARAAIETMREPPRPDASAGLIGDCEHQWVSAPNGYVELCRKCGSIKL
jgi:hypothetical protein